MSHCRHRYMPLQNVTCGIQGYRPGYRPGYRGYRPGYRGYRPGYRPGYRRVFVRRLAYQWDTEGYRDTDNPQILTARLSRSVMH